MTAKQANFRWCDVFDDICRIGRGSFCPVNRRHGTDGQTEGRGATLYATSRAGRISMRYTDIVQPLTEVW